MGERFTEFFGEIPVRLRRGVYEPPVYEYMERVVLVSVTAAAADRGTPSHATPFSVATAAAVLENSAAATQVQQRAKECRVYSAVSDLQKCEFCSLALTTAVQMS